MSLRSRHIGQNLVFYQGHYKRLIDAIGPDVYKFIEDFAISPLEDPDSPVGATVTLVEAGAGETTLTAPNEVGGALLITTDAAENDGANVQWSESFELTADQPAVYFGCRFKTGEALQSDILLGLCITDTDLLGGMTHGVYFRKVDGSATLAFVTEKASTETEDADVGTIVVDTYMTVEFYFENATVYAFVDGALVATHTTNIPNDEILAPSIQFLTGNAVVETLTIDWIRVIAIGR